MQIFKRSPPEITVASYGYLRILALGSISVLLTGCIMSNGLLFEREAARTPISPGMFEEQHLYNGRWVRYGQSDAVLENRTYRVNGETIMFFDVGHGFFVAARQHQQSGEEEKPDADGIKYEYDLVKVKNNLVLAYGARCQDLTRARAWTYVAEIDDQKNCIFSTQESLTTSLLSLAQRNVPVKRFIRKAHR